jgi:hypothetical protein
MNNRKRVEGINNHLRGEWTETMKRAQEKRKNETGERTREDLTASRKLMQEYANVLEENGEMDCS